MISSCIGLLVIPSILSVQEWYCYGKGVRNRTAKASLAWRGLSSAVSEGRFPMILLHVSYEGLMLQITFSAVLVLLLVYLNSWMWPSGLSWCLSAWASPALGKGVKKECSGWNKPIYKCAALVICRIHCANSFLCVKLLFRARTFWLLSLCYCFIYLLNLLSCVSWNAISWDKKGVLHFLTICNFPFLVEKHVPSVPM